MKNYSNLLAFDTVLNKTYITHFCEGEFVNRVIESDEKNYHSAYLISELKKFPLKNLEAIAVNIGPGSFTGIRVCLTVANVMGAQLNVPLIGVSSCEILSQIAPEVLLDARRGKYIYYDGSEAKLIDKTSAAPKGEFVGDSNVCMFLGGGINYETGNYPLGEILMKLALNRKGEKQLKPLYLQTPPVC